MKSFCIKTNNKQIINYLVDEFSNINLNNIYISSNSFKTYDNVIIHYTSDKTNLFITKISLILTNCIIKFYEKSIIKNILSYNYFYFNELEKNQIFLYSLDALKSPTDSSNTRLDELYNSVFQYICNNKYFILSGFVNFRLQNYHSFLDSIVDLSVNKFLIEREYAEFINLLKLYVNSKESNNQVIHLIYINQESILLDNEQNIISTNDNLFKATYLSDISFSSNDYTLNTLLNILPTKINIHLVDNYSDEFINTIKSVFENRVFICNDCDICKIYKLSNNLYFK